MCTLFPVCTPTPYVPQPYKEHAPLSAAHLALLRLTRMRMAEAVHSVLLRSAKEYAATLDSYQVAVAAQSPWRFCVGLFLGVVSSGVMLSFVVVYPSSDLTPLLIFSTHNPNVHTYDLRDLTHACTHAHVNCAHPS